MLDLKIEKNELQLKNEKLQIEKIKLDIEELKMENYLLELELKILREEDLFSAQIEQLKTIATAIDKKQLFKQKPELVELIKKIMENKSI